ncbi:protein of unknown function [Paraburkholderia kururiensis]
MVVQDTACGSGEPLAQRFAREWTRHAPLTRAVPFKHPDSAYVELYPQAPAADDPDAPRRTDADLRRDPVRAGWAGGAGAA